MKWDYFREARTLQAECFRDFGIGIEIRAILSFSPGSDDPLSGSPDSISWDVAIQSCFDSSPSKWIRSFVEKFAGIRSNNRPHRILARTPLEAYRSFKLAMFDSFVDDGLIRPIPMHPATKMAGYSKTDPASARELEASADVRHGGSYTNTASTPIRIFGSGHTRFGETVSKRNTWRNAFAEKDNNKVARNILSTETQESPAMSFDLSRLSQLLEQLAKEENKVFEELASYVCLLAKTLEISAPEVLEQLQARFPKDPAPPEVQAQKVPTFDSDEFKSMLDEEVSDH